MLGITRQNYYSRRRQRRRQKVDEGLIVELVRRERNLQPRLGIRKLYHMLKDELAEEGVKIGRDRMFEVLGKRNLLVVPKRAEHPRTTVRYKTLLPYGNLIKQMEVTEPNQVWVADITYIRTREGFLYLSLITDKYSRKIVGYYSSDSLMSGGSIKALKMALAQLPAGKKPVHHSDQGVQYYSHRYVEELEKRQLPISMTEANHCAENAMAERVNGILKSEYGLDQEIKSKREACKMTDQAVMLYNNRRPHTALGYRIPNQVHALAA